MHENVKDDRVLGCTMNLRSIKSDPSIRLKFWEEHFWDPLATKLQPSNHIKYRRIVQIPTMFFQSTHSALKTVIRK